MADGDEAGSPWNSAVSWLRSLQTDITGGIERLDQGAAFRTDCWDRPGGGGGRSMVLESGNVFEKAGVNFSEISGSQLPPAASARRPHLAGSPFRAAGVSLVLHPLNPHVPTTHMNVRIFEVSPPGSKTVCWFGGGFDLTPYLPVMDDVVDWHRAARAACVPFGDFIYPRFKKTCDEYFYLPHRNETRGVGGLFFDDFDELGDGQDMALWKSIGEAFWPAYSAIVARRKDETFAEEQRRFQLVRRGRYVEFNLLYDRGTLFGLQSGGRTESILMSLPPLVRWDYVTDSQDDPLAAELVHYLKPRDWLGEAAI